MTRAKTVCAAMLMLALAPLVLFATGTGEPAGKPAQVVVWSTSDMKPLVEWMQALQTSFNAGHKDIQIKVEFKADQGFEQLLMTSAAAKTGPDVYDWWAGPFTTDMGSRGALLDVTTLYPKEKWDQALGVEYVTVNGRRYAVPIELYYEILMYNRDVFKKAGLDPNTFPETWDQLMDACEKLKAIGVAPFAFANKEGYIADVLVEGFSIEKFSDAEDLKKSLIYGTFTEPRYLEGLARVKELYDKGYLFEGGMSEPYSLYTSQIISGQAGNCPRPRPVLQRSDQADRKGHGACYLPQMGRGRAGGKAEDRIEHCLVRHGVHEVPQAGGRGAQGLHQPGQLQPAVQDRGDDACDDELGHQPYYRLGNAGDDRKRQEARDRSGLLSPVPKLRDLRCTDEELLAVSAR